MALATCILQLCWESVHVAKEGLSLLLSDSLCLGGTSKYVMYMLEISTISVH